MSFSPSLPLLETERLHLRYAAAEDAEFMLELLNEPAFIRNVADRQVRSTADAVTYIEEKILTSYARHGFGFYIVALKSSGALIGICGLIKRETLADVDIGFAFLERYWGRGYAYEAAASLLDHAHNVLGITKIVGVTSPQNRPSAALLEKLGMKFQQTIHLPGYGAESHLFA